MTQQLFATDALLPTGWARNVLITWDGAGRITAVTPNAQPNGTSVASGPVLPGMPNLHSHAFQRAFVGLTEYRGPSRWRLLRPGCMWRC
jgi:formimidoylglutamate deiminase